MNATSNIRKMTLSDLPQVLALEQVSHPLPWSEASLRRSFDDHYGVVLIQSQRIAGFAFVQRILDEAHLLDIVIDPALRGQGLGRFLLDELMHKIFCEGINIWFLEVRVSNTSAIALYQSLGYNELGIRRNYYDGPNGREDALMMACTVS